METTVKTLINFLYTLVFLSNTLFAQESYREDQIYFGSSYFIQTEKIPDFKQNGFSGNFQFGFIRDIPLNKSSTNALGLGLGFERNYFTSNIQPTQNDNNIDYRIIVSKFLESKNKISYSSVSFPLEYRWRNSKVDTYEFWRVYSGIKIKKNFKIKSNPAYGLDLDIKDFEPWTSSLYLNVGYNTWNISLEYDLDPIIKNKKTENGDNLDISFFRLGLIFYLL